jgi:hypothetical protein
MPGYRFNKNFAALFRAYAAVASVVGGIGYGGYYLLTAPDSPETAARRAQSNTMRLEIANYLQLSREMLLVAPPAEYPESSQGTAKQTFAEAEDIIDNTGIGNIPLRCELVTYLRAIHRIATENYISSKPVLPLPNLQTHIDAANRNVPVAPVCTIK